MITRSASDEPWSKPMNLGSTINSPEHDDTFPSISGDGTTLYFNRYTRNDEGPQWEAFDILEAAIKPFETVSLNGQGGRYEENFDSMGIETPAGGAPLPLDSCALIVFSASW